MGTTEAPKIIPVQLGSYSADAKLGKASGMSPDSLNMRFDVFGNLLSVLGNTAYNPNQCAGGYTLGGDAFQYIRKDGTFDVVLSRVRAESKIYQATAVGALQTNIINTSAGGWNSGN